MPFCEYCNREFDNKSNVNKHQKTSLYCIKIQREKDPSKNLEIIVHECEFCKRQLTTKYSLQTHLTTCKEKLKSMEKEDSEMAIMKKEMSNLQKEVAQLKEKPTITVTNNTNNNTDNSIKTITHNYSSLLDCSTESITEMLRKHYNKIEHLLQGDQKHLADVTVKHLLSGKDQPMYYVTDRSRNKFMYTDSDKNEKEDANASILRSLVYRGVKPIVKGLYQDEFKRLRKELAMYQRKDDEDADACVMSRHRDLKELEEAYHQMDIIKESDDYVVQLSKCLPSSIRDRIYRDSLIMRETIEYDSDDEFKRQLEHESRMIGDYSVLELQKYKDIYRQTGETRGPPSIIENPKYRKEFVSFLTET
jgi:hypothetical protein